MTPELSLLLTRLERLTDSDRSEFLALLTHYCMHSDSRHAGEDAEQRKLFARSGMEEILADGGRPPALTRTASV